MRFSLSLCVVASLLLISSNRGKAQDAPQVEISSDTTFIYDGQELAQSLRDAYAIGESAGAQQSVLDSVIYLISEKEGATAAKIVAGAYNALTTSNDTTIAADISVAFGAAIEVLFRDPDIMVVTSDVAAAVAPAIASQQTGISAMTMTALQNVASAEYCPEVGAVLVKAKLEAKRIESEKAFTAALKSYKNAALEDVDAAALVQCASKAFDGLV